MREHEYTLPWIEVFCVGLDVSGLSYTPLCAHSFLKFKRIGVPGNGLLLRLCMVRPTLNMAVPELLPLQGRKTLKSERNTTVQSYQKPFLSVETYLLFSSLGIRPLVLIDTVGAFNIFSSMDSSKSKL